MVANFLGTLPEETYRSLVQLPNTYDIIMHFVPKMGTKSSHFRSEIRLSEGMAISLALRTASLR
jgi:hypothetical protein